MNTSNFGGPTSHQPGSFCTHRAESSGTTSDFTPKTGCSEASLLKPHSPTIFVTNSVNISKTGENDNDSKSITLKSLIYGELG